MKLFRWIPLAAVLILAACATPVSDSAEGNVSRDMAALAAGLNDQLTMDVQASMINEATASTEVSTTADVAVARSAASRNAVVTVTHSIAAHTFAAGDVVQVVRAWTSARGESVVDTVIRPKLPAAADFTSPGVYTPAAGNGIDLTGVSASYDAAGGTWTLNATEVQSLDGMVFRQQAFTFVYTWNTAGTGSLNLVSIRKHGESVGLRTARVKLDTTIWYDQGDEYLRVLDYIAHPASGADSTLKREVYLWGVDPTTLAAQPFVLTNGTALTFTPALAPQAGSTTVDFWYRSPTAQPVTDLHPVHGDETTYPALDTADWTGSVLRESGPRTADWYKPAADPADGTYLRALTRAYTPSSETVSRYASDGTTVVKTHQAAVCRTTSDGTITTTWTFADGKTRKVSVTPTGDENGKLTGYIIVRGTVTYTVVFGFGTDGLPTSASVTNSRTGVTVTYTVQPDGTWK